MPLLQQVLSLETIKNVLNTVDPNKLIGTITNSIGDLAKIGQAGQKQEIEHLERLNPGTATPDLIQLLEGMSLSSALARPAADRGPGDYRRVDGVTLHFADLSPQTLAGRPQTCFVRGSEIGFPLAVETPKPIAGARLYVTVRRPVSGKVVVEQVTDIVEELTAGRLPVVPTLDRADADRLEAGEEYLVRATLVWRSGRKQGRRLGITMNQLITVIEPMTFDRLEQTSEVLALADVQAHREFWHKAWETTFDDEHRKVSFSCTYNYALDPKATENAQMETVTDTERSSVRHEEGTLRSGLVLGLYALNKLLARTAHPQLGEEHLRALATPEFVERFSQSAKASVSMRGRDGESAGLWVYPEMRLPELVLAEARDVNEFGQVLGFGERRVRFPVPALAHFIGVRSR